MKLTGKCKEGFLKYISCIHGLDESDYDLHKEIFINALIIDFFDSILIYINIEYNEVAKKFGYFISLDPVCNDILSLSKFNSRNEATTEAIKKANEIFNTNQ